MDPRRLHPLSWLIAGPLAALVLGSRLPRPPFGPLRGLGVPLMFAGLGLVAASWFLIGMAALALVLVRLRLPKEEAQLEDRFGQEYRDYVSRTGRFLPRWSR